jgi:hypothetical protein
VPAPPPQPPKPTAPDMSNVILAWQTDFRNADYETPYRLKGLGLLDGADGNFINDGSNAAVKTYFATYPDGQKAFCLQQLNDTETDRAEFNLFVRSATKTILGKEFLFENYFYIPSDYKLSSATDKWLIINAVDDALGYLPKWQTLFLGNSSAHPEVAVGQTDLLIDHHAYPSGSLYEYLCRLHNYPIPTGRWFKLSWYQKFDAHHGKIKLWIDDRSVFDLSGLLTEDNTTNPNDYFYISISKLYGDPHGTFPRAIWVSNISLYNVTAPAAK